MARLNTLIGRDERIALRQHARATASYRHCKGKSSDNDDICWGVRCRQIVGAEGGFIPNVLLFT